MPCRDYESDRPQVREVVPVEVKERLDLLSRTLCRIFTYVEDAQQDVTQEEYRSQLDAFENIENILEGEGHPDSEAIQSWWVAHKEADRKAAEKEELGDRIEALSLELSELKQQYYKL